MKRTLCMFLSLCLLILAFNEVASGQSTSSNENYTIRFDMNTTPEDIEDDETFEYEVQSYDANWQPITEKRMSVLTIPWSENAYISSAIPAPAREGYVFAGWQTRPVVTEEDLVCGVSPYLWLFGAQSIYGDSSVVMPIRDMETLDGNGVGTLYARWVRVKDISTEEELRAIANDLYGAYRLTADIELSAEWTPIGLYFNNYEFYAREWWTYAFRGSLDGNGHAIKGLSIRGAKVDVSAYHEDHVVWHNDGDRADGCAAMFGAINTASIHDLTLDAPLIDVSQDDAAQGDYIYAAPLAAFDMNSAVTNVNVNAPCVTVESFDIESSHLGKLYAAVSGLIGGGWNDTLTNCHVQDGTVSFHAETSKSHGGEAYVGGMVGECYSTINHCASSSKIEVSVIDNSEETTDAELKVNVGGLSAASTTVADSTVNAPIVVSVTKPTGAANVSVGGLSGSQRYFTTSGNTVQSDITAECSLDEEKGSFNVGRVSGQLDTYYALQILMYTPVASAGCTENTAKATLNGVSVKNMIGLVPELDGVPLGWINKGEYQIADGYVVSSNIEAVAEKYGSYMPIEYMQNGIIWIQND